MNAAQYTDPGGVVQMTVHSSEGFVTTTVRDNGRGIEPELKERIFDMFVRGKHGKSDTGSGLGVGLALSQKIVELHGGSVDVTSEGAGKGSEFIVRLPVAQPQHAVQSAPAPLKPIAPQRVLLVDDNRDAAAALEMVLKEMGHRTFVVHGGAEALETIYANDLDFVFLDLGMPGIDGYEVARRVRANKQVHQPRLIALTGWGQEDDRRQTRDAGFDAHLVKPVSSDDLARALAH